MFFGIDFGTSNCVIAVCPSEGKPEALEIDSVDAAWRGIGLERVFPSILARERDGFLCGWAAKFAESDRVDAVKRMLESDDEIDLGGLQVSPTIVAGAILDELRRRARNTGHLINEAVLSIPANATGRQRYRTMLAAERASIQPTRLINEPTAAALAFMARLPAAQRNGNYLVFDWGGGTLDVTILKHQEGISQEVISRGVKKWGGVDFDRRFEQAVLKKLSQEIAFDAMQLQMLERKKIALSTEDQVNITAGGRNATLSRAEFEASCQDLIDGAMACVDAALTDFAKEVGPPSGRSDGARIDWPVLVGGTSQIPAVRDALSRRISAHHERLGLPKDAWDLALVSPAAFDPMTAVAEGAAVAASIARGVHSDEQLNLTMANDMGVVVHDPETDAHRFSRIIRRGTNIPFQGRWSYSLRRPDQRLIKVRIVEGYVDRALDDESNIELTTLEVEVPEHLRSTSSRRFVVEFTYDENALMHVRVIWRDPHIILFDGKVRLQDPSIRDGRAREMLATLARRPTPLIASVAVGVDDEAGGTLAKTGEIAHAIADIPQALRATASSIGATTSRRAANAGPFVVVDGSNIACEVSNVNGGDRMSYRKLLAAVDQFVVELEIAHEGLILVVDANFRHNVSREEKRAVEEDEQSGFLNWPPAQAVGKADELILKVAGLHAKRGRTIILTNDRYSEFRDRYREVFNDVEVYGVTLVGLDVHWQRRSLSSVIGTRSVGVGEIAGVKDGSHGGAEASGSGRNRRGVGPSPKRARRSGIHPDSIPRGGEGSFWHGGE